MKMLFGFKVILLSASVAGKKLVYLHLWTIRSETT